VEYDWRVLYPTLNAVYVVGDGESVWAVGPAGAILHSADGVTWKPQSSGTASDLRSVYGNKKTLWAVGTGGTVLHSTDGETWKLQSSGTTSDLFSLYGTGDGKTMWAVGENGTILHSSDGETWTTQSSGTTETLLSVYGTGDGKTLWAVGDNGSILHSTNGETWKRQSSGTTEVLLSVYGTGDGKTLWAVGAGETILHSSDGETWNPQSSGGTTDVFLSVYGTSDGKNLWAVGSGGGILHSTDGETWKPQSSGTAVDLRSVYGTGDGRTLWAVGNSGTILKSIDGDTWKSQLATTTNPLESVYGTADGKKLWAVGGSGTILYSTDGAIWMPQSSGTNNFLGSVYGTGDGKTLWAVGARGTVLHSTDGETWTPQASGITGNLISVFGTGDGKTLWAVADNGTILHSSDGETWNPQSSGTTGALHSVYGTGDGKTFWAVTVNGTILHSTDGATWKPQPSVATSGLRSVYGTRNSKALWAVGAGGTVLHTTDGETWTAQSSGTTEDLLSVYGTGDGKTLWAVGENGTILHSSDGETWTTQSSGTAERLLSVYGTGDGKTLWVVGFSGTILRGAIAGRGPYIEGGQFVRTASGPFLKLKIACPDPRNKPLTVDITGRNFHKFVSHKDGSNIPVKGNVPCGVLNAAVDLDDLEMSSGDWGYFDIKLQSRTTSTLFRYQQRYDPWRWFIEHREGLGVLAAIMSVFLVFWLLLFFAPLWIVRLYLTLKHPSLDKLFGIPVAGPILDVIFRLCTLGLPWFVAHSRTLDAWVGEHRAAIEQRWSQETLPARAVVSERQRAVEATPYVPLPLRIDDPSGGRLISQPTSDEISKQFSAKRTLIQVIGPGGAGKTTFARQCGLWALMGGRPGGLRSHAMLPVWIDEDLGTDKPLSQVVRAKLTALLPDEKMDDVLLGALLQKQRLLTIVDRLSERSTATQAYFGNIYRTTRAEAMLITTRIRIPVDGVTPISLFPQPLNQRTLLYFMQALLQPDGATNDIDVTDVSLDDQLSLGHKLRELYLSSVRAGGNILPLPVRLFVEEAMTFIVASRSLESLPRSIPDIYSRYLERVNPDNPSVPNFMSHAEMLRAAKILSKLALGDDFIPKEFDAEDASAELRKEGWTDPQKVDPIERLVDNGVLLSKGELLNRRLKFALDPIAEYLCAAASLREARYDRSKLDFLRNRAQHAAGFVAALDLLAQGNESRLN
jgi:photosystem II stability/assembly factor-like uncharacterized protein